MIPLIIVRDFKAHAEGIEEKIWNIGKGFESECRGLRYLIGEIIKILENNEGFLSIMKKNPILKYVKELDDLYYELLGTDTNVIAITDELEEFFNFEY